MDFLAAPLLWGLAAAGVPVILHLMGRSKPVVHRFPAMRFILRSQRASSRALRLKHLLVLALRILAICLIALTLARPLWNAVGLYLIWAGAGLALALLAGIALYRREFILAAVGVLALTALYQLYPSQARGSQELLRGDYVLVLDQSMSMGYQEPEGTRFELARRQALKLLDRLAPEARVALVLAAHTAERVQGRLSLRQDLVRQKLLEASPGGSALDLGRALLAAGEIVGRERGAGAGRQAYIILFTDLQANTLGALATRIPPLRPVSDPSSRTVPLIVVDVGSEDARNGAALAAVVPARILPAESTVTLNGKIRPADKDRPCLVELYLDERRIAQKLFEPKGRDVLDIEFQFATGAPGPHAMRLNLADSDRLPFDQDAWVTYVAGRPARALILESPPAEKRPKGTAFFLKAALQPRSTEQALSLSGLNFDIEPPQELSRQKLAGYKVVILADCGDLNDASWSALQQWCDDGGGLFVWLGPNTNPALAQRYAFLEHARYRGLLPGSIVGVVTPAKPLPVTVAQSEHPVLAHFAPGVVSVLRQTEVRKFVKILPQVEDAAATVVLSLGDGSPLLLEKSYGRGRVLLCAVDPGTEFSDLPKRAEAFVTLLLDAMRLLGGQEGDINARLGAPLLLTLNDPPPDRQVFWRPPGAQDPIVLRVEMGEAERDPKSKEGASETPATATLVVPPLEKTGVHRFSWTPRKTQAPLTRLVAVNTDPAESDLTRASRDAASKALAAWQPVLVKSLSEAGAFKSLDESADAAGARREYAAVLLLALLAVLLAESFLSNRLYHAGHEAALPDEVAENAAGGAHGAS